MAGWAGWLWWLLMLLRPPPPRPPYRQVTMQCMCRAPRAQRKKVNAAGPQPATSQSNDVNAGCIHQCVPD